MGICWTDGKGLNTADTKIKISIENDEIKYYEYMAYYWEDYGFSSQEEADNWIAGVKAGKDPDWIYGDPEEVEEDDDDEEIILTEGEYYGIPGAYDQDGNFYPDDIEEFYSKMKEIEDQE